MFFYFGTRECFWGHLVHPEQSEGRLQKAFNNGALDITMPCEDAASSNRDIASWEAE
jgi:hypothetical protein